MTDGQLSEGELIAEKDFQFARFHAHFDACEQCRMTDDIREVCEEMRLILKWASVCLDLCGFRNVRQLTIRTQPVTFA